MTELSSLRLKDLPTPLKLVISLTLIVLGIGYLVALANLYLTYNLTDGEPGLTPADLSRAFYGNRDNTKLAAKINGGSMEQFLPKSGEKEKILSWIQDGAGREGFEKVVKPILAANCVRCHNPEGLWSFLVIYTYEEVMVVAQIDRGEPASLWTRVPHSHILAITLVFLVLGMVFAFTSVPEKLKNWIVVLPFLVLLLDFGARFLARFSESIVYLMLLSGSSLGLLFAIMVLVPLYEMWFKKSTV